MRRIKDQSNQRVPEMSWGRAYRSCTMIPLQGNINWYVERRKEIRGRKKLGMKINWLQCSK